MADAEPKAKLRRKTTTSLIVSYFFAFLLFWAPLCLVVGTKKYLFGALYKNRGDNGVLVMCGGNDS